MKILDHLSGVPRDSWNQPIIMDGLEVLTPRGGGAWISDMDGYPCKERVGNCGDSACNTSLY